MLVAIFIAILVVLASVLIHYEALRLTSDIIPRLVFHPQRRILFVLMATLVVHVVSISLLPSAIFR